MLPIPKELQGQKAIPFMEWCIKNAVLTLVTQNGQTRENYFEIPEYFLNFFNQPFTPEMLTEYFEGVKVDDKYKLYRNNKGLYLRYYYVNDGYYLRNNDKGLSEFKGLKNLSLNDLITLCNLAGVELTWKGEK